MLVSKNPGLIEFAKAYRNYGKFDYKVAGLNYRPSEFTAALGVVQVDRMDEITAWKNDVAQNHLNKRYVKRLQLPDGMISGLYKYIVFEPIEKSTGKVYDQAVYPDVITYAYRNGALIGPAREVRFIRGPRTDWTDTTAKTFVSLFEKERVEAIEVSVGGSLVRKYVFGFDYSMRKVVAD